MLKYFKSITISIGRYQGILGGTFRGVVIPLTEPNDDVEIGFYSNNYSTYTVKKFSTQPSFGLYGYTEEDIKTEPAFEISYIPANGGYEQLLHNEVLDKAYHLSPGFEENPRYGREFFAIDNREEILNTKKYNGTYKVCDSNHQNLSCAIVIVDIDK